jgi:hypothetical protein
MDQTLELMKYDKLKNMTMETFKTYIAYFNNEDYINLQDKFDITQALRFGQQLLDNNFTLSNFTLEDVSEFLRSGGIYSQYQTTGNVFNDYLSFIHSLIDSLNSAVNLSKENKLLNEEVVTLTEYKNILSDVELLKKYIEEHYNYFSATLFHVDKQLDTKLKIKAEYMRYIELYGVPDHGIFESEKLSKIIEELGIVV